VKKISNIAMEADFGSTYNPVYYIKRFLRKMAALYRYLTLLLLINSSLVVAKLFSRHFLWEAVKA